MDLILGTAGTSGRAVIRVGGDVDIDTAPSLRYAVRELLQEGTHDLVVDLSAVDFIDSTGLGVLVGALKDAQRNGGSLELMCTQRRMLSLLHLTGLNEAFTIHEVDIAGTR
jgi:anti-sigma B factor antagonist